jgi:hypothetical protein
LVSLADIWRSLSRNRRGDLINIERRDLLKLATTSLASMMLMESAIQPASASNLISLLPINDYPQMAWTIDDGCSNESLESHIQLAIDYNLRFKKLNEEKKFG